MFILTPHECATLISLLKNEHRRTALHYGSRKNSRAKKSNTQHRTPKVFQAARAQGEPMFDVAGSESLLSLLRMHRDHELIFCGRERLRRALIVSSDDAHGRSGLDGVSPYLWRFMGEPPRFRDRALAHEPFSKTPNIQHPRSTAFKPPSWGSRGWVLNVQCSMLPALGSLDLQKLEARRVTV